MQGNAGDLVGRKLGTCTLEKMIGRGGMGAVYLAHQERPARNVAVKVLLPHLGGGDNQMSQAFQARFRREADVIARLEHMNIMPIYEYGEQEGLAYLVMPYLTGGSLNDILEQQGSISLSAMMTFLEQAAAALDYAHARGVIHRDLKPANFLLHADGRLVLGDFGIARIIEESNPGSTLTGTGMLIGTPEYMAPEMASGEEIDYRADIYELGVVIFKMLSGRAPFSGNTPLAVLAKHLQAPLPLLHELKPEIPVAVDIVIQKATAKQRENRYASVQEMVQVLHTALDYMSYHGNAQEYVPTALSPGILHVLPTSTSLQGAMPAVEKELTTSVQSQAYTPPYPGIAPTSPELASWSSQHSVPPAPQRKEPWRFAFIVMLLIVFIVSSIFAGIQINRNSQVQQPSPDSTTSVQTTARSTTTGQTTVATMTAIVTAASTSQATASVTPTSKPKPKPTFPPPTQVSDGLSMGTQLYITPAPGPMCDTNGGQWVIYNGASLACYGGSTHLHNVAHGASLQGIFLTGIPGYVYPANYVIEVTLQQNVASASNFGLYFRNQPGDQQGTYTFLVQSDGTWGTYVYDNNTGVPQKIDKGAFGDIHAETKLAVVVSGQHFSFFANGKALGSVTDSSYASGTVGIAVDQGGTVTVSNFALYATNPA